MRPRHIQFLLAFAAFVLGLTMESVRADDISIEATADRPRIYLGEPVILQVKVAGNRDVLDVDLTAIKNCQVRQLGSQDISSQSITIINGVMQRRGFIGRVYVFEITPQDEGDFTAGPISLSYKGRNISTPGPVISVTGIQKQDVVKITVEPSRTTVLADEPFEITLRLRIRQLPGRFAGIDPIYPNQPPTLTVPFLEQAEVAGLKNPDIGAFLREKLINNDNQPGFAINKYTVRRDPMDTFFNFGADMNNPFAERPARFIFPRRAIVENGISYFEYSATIAYSAEQEGNYTFGPVIFKGTVPAGGDGNTEPPNREIFAVGPAATVRAIPPPEENRPECYIGAIGSNLTVEAALDTQTCKVGDPLKLTLTIGGNVQMRNVYPPHLSLQPGLLNLFTIYEDNIQTIKNDSQRHYVYTLRPVVAGTIEVPPIDVAYYDAINREYRTVRSQPIPLRVNRTSEITATQVIGINTNNTVQRPPRNGMTTWSPPMRMKMAAAPATLFGNARTTGLVAAIGPALLLAGTLIWGLRRGWRSFGNRRRRTGAGQRAIHALHKATALIESNQGSARRHLVDAVRTFIADRFDLPARSLTPGDLPAMLAEKGVAQEFAQQTGQIVERHFNAAFAADAPGAAADIRRDCEMLIGIITKIEQSTTGPATQPARRANLALLAGIITIGMSSLVNAAESDAAHNFMRQEADTRLIRARSAADFTEAARACQRLIDAGIRDGTLFFNQGAAFMQAGFYADALTAFLRAERYAGSDLETARAIQTCLAHIQRQPDALLPWYRFPLFWHYDLGCSVRAMIAAGAFSVIFIAFGLWRVVRWRALRTVMVFAILTCAIFATSVASTLYQESHATQPTYNIKGGE